MLRLRGSGEGQGKKRAKLEEDSIPTLMMVPTALDSDISQGKDAINTKKIMIEPWIDSLSLTQLQELNKNLNTKS